MNATLFIVGVGPGDPDLLTLKGAKILEKCPVIVSPKSSLKGTSTALSIIKKKIDMKEKEVHELLFPMKKIYINSDIDNTVQEAWRNAASLILNHLGEGKDVAFPTLGDPAIYSTGYYLFETIRNISPGVSVQFIPGIPAMSCCSATTCTPICLGDEMLAVIPATFSDQRTRQILKTFDTIILMKVHRVYDQLTELLNELGLLDRSILIEKAGMEDERIVENLTKSEKPIHYFSTIIVRKNRSKLTRDDYLHAIALASIEDGNSTHSQMHK